MYRTSAKLKKRHFDLRGLHIRVITTIGLDNIQRYYQLSDPMPKLGILHNKLVIDRYSHQPVSVYFEMGRDRPYDSWYYTGEWYYTDYTLNHYFTDKNNVKNYTKNGFVLEWSCSNNQYSKNWSQYPDMLETDATIRLLTGVLITVVATFLVILLLIFNRRKITTMAQRQPTWHPAGVPVTSRNNAIEMVNSSPQGSMSPLMSPPSYDEVVNEDAKMLPSATNA